jgi:hypothetical protein
MPHIIWNTKAHYRIYKCPTPVPVLSQLDPLHTPIPLIIIIIIIISAQLHFNVCKETGVQLDKKHWYEHVPKSVETSQGSKVTILWNQQVQTDRTVPNNKPDIIRDNEKGTCMLIDVAISGDRNVIKKEEEKILKYKDLTIEIQRMWNVKARVIPAIIGATGTISKSLRNT